MDSLFVSCYFPLFGCLVITEVTRELLYLVMDNNFVLGQASKPRGLIVTLVAGKAIGFIMHKLLVSTQTCLTFGIIIATITRPELAPMPRLFMLFYVFNQSCFIVA